MTIINFENEALQRLFLIMISCLNPFKIQGYCCLSPKRVPNTSEVYFMAGVRKASQTWTAKPCQRQTFWHRLLRVHQVHSVHTSSWQTLFHQLFNCVILSWEMIKGVVFMNCILNPLVVYNEASFWLVLIRWTTESLISLRLSYVGEAKIQRDHVNEII